MKNVWIVGAGQLGSRHLQALKNVKHDQKITVIDPSAQSLAVAKERFEQIKGIGGVKEVSYLQQIPQLSEEIDLVIVATNSDYRAAAILDVFRTNCPNNIIFEKLLFNTEQAFADVGEAINKSGSNAWVNCSMRVMPFYQNIKSQLNSERILYSVAGSQYGLVTNSVHYIDHIAFLTDCTDYSVNTDRLIPQLIPSKRQGFHELDGTLSLRFANGSVGDLTCFPTGSTPVMVQIMTPECRYLSREDEGLMWYSDADSGWQWQELEARIPYQSEMTTDLVNDIFEKEDCGLIPYEQSALLHLTLLASLKTFINGFSTTPFDAFPFT